MEIEEFYNDLNNKIMDSEKVIIVPHNNVDFDALASAVGIALLARSFNKEFYIVITDSLSILDDSLKSVLEKQKKDFNIINKDKYISMFSPDDLFVAVDVNQRHRIGISEYINDESKTVIIDHHDVGDDTANANCKYINPKRSSTSEIVFNLLEYNNIMISPSMANFLYAGIYLDTAKLTKNCSADTMRTIARLLDCKADINKVNKFFQEDLYSDRKVQSLVDKIEIITFKIGLMVGDEDKEYKTKEIARAADYALIYGCDATFAIGNVEDDNVFLSARAPETVDISWIMNQLGGGGNQYSGAAKLNDVTVEEVHKNLARVLKPQYYIDND